jgi:hypothetical protein
VTEYPSCINIGMMDTLVDIGIGTLVYITGFLVLLIGLALTSTEEK